MRDAGIERLATEPPEVLRYAKDWPLPHHDYENTRATFDSSITAANIATLSERFRVALPGLGAFGHATSGALVLGERIFVQDMGSNVYAVARDDGSEQWTWRDDEQSIGPNGVAVGWGRLFAMRGDLGAVALDLDSGRELWRFDPNLRSSEGLDIQPMVYAGMVLLSTVPASLRGAYSGGSRGQLFALDARTGVTRWSFDTIDSPDLWGDPEHNSGGGAWYPPTVDRARGITYWGTGNPGPLPGLPPDIRVGETRPGDNAYTSGVLAIGLEHGELRWFHQEQKHDLFDWDFQNPPILVHGSDLGGGSDLLIGSGKTGTVVGLDAETGAVRFRTKVGLHQNDELTELPDEGIVVAPGLFGGVLTPPAYADGVVYVPVVNFPARFSPTSSEFAELKASGEVTATDVRDGSVLWTHVLPEAALGAATVVNDLVIVSDANGVIYALARADGATVFEYATHGGINAPISVAGNLLLVPVGESENDPALLVLGVSP